MPSRKAKAAKAEKEKTAKEIGRQSFAISVLAMDIRSDFAPRLSARATPRGQTGAEFALDMRTILQSALRKVEANTPSQAKEEARARTARGNPSGEQDRAEKEFRHSMSGSP